MAPETLEFLEGNMWIVILGAVFLFSWIKPIPGDDTSLLTLIINWFMGILKPPEEGMGFIPGLLANSNIWVLLVLGFLVITVFGGGCEGGCKLPFLPQ